MSNKVKSFPVSCPSCSDSLAVTRLCCDDCGTEVMGHYPLPDLALLPAADQSFVLHFVRCSGSLKEMAKHLKVSYPTVRNRLNEIIEHLQNDAK